MKTELKDIYQKVLKCKVCGREYGSDIKKDSGMCPFCDPAYIRRRNGAS